MESGSDKRKRPRHEGRVFISRAHLGSIDLTPPEIQLKKHDLSLWIGVRLRIQPNPAILLLWFPAKKIEPVKTVILSLPIP